MSSPTHSVPKRPSAWRVFNNDTPAYVAAVIGGAAVLIAILGLSNGGRFPTLPSDPSVLLLFAGASALAILFFLYFAWRVRYISSLVALDEEVKARLSNVAFQLGIKSQDSYEANLTFHFRGELYKIDRSIPFRPSRPFRPLKDGDELVLIIDPNNPRKFVLRDDYLQTAGEVVNLLG